MINKPTNSEQSDSGGTERAAVARIITPRAFSMAIVLMASALAYSSLADDDLTAKPRANQLINESVKRMTATNWSLLSQSPIHLNQTADRARYLDSLRKQGQIIVF